jgi:hypothetical protein
LPEDKAADDTLVIPPELDPEVPAKLSLQRKDKTEVDWEYYLEMHAKEMARAVEYLAVLRQSE